MASEFDKLQERIQTIFGSVDDLAIVVLKGHLLIEEMLDTIIRRFVFHPEYLDGANLRFAQKLHIARSLSLDEHGSGMWEIAIRLNTLRNELAHKLESDKRAAKTKGVIDAYFAEADQDEHFKLIQGQTEPVILMFAASYFLGFLNNFREEADRFRSVVDGLDRVANLHRHATGATASSEAKKANE